jgi:hypothetical protein
VRVRGTDEYSSPAELDDRRALVNTRQNKWRDDFALFVGRSGSLYSNSIVIFMGRATCTHPNE